MRILYDATFIFLSVCAFFRIAKVKAFNIWNTKLNRFGKGKSPPPPSSYLNLSNFLSSSTSALCNHDYNKKQVNGREGIPTLPLHHIFLEWENLDHFFMLYPPLNSSLSLSLSHIWSACKSHAHLVKGIFVRSGELPKQRKKVALA